MRNSTSILSHRLEFQLSKLKMTDDTMSHSALRYSRSSDERRKAGSLASVSHLQLNLSVPLEWGIT